MHVVKLFSLNLWFRPLLKDIWLLYNAFSCSAVTIVFQLELSILLCIASVPVGPHLLQKLEKLFVWGTWEDKRREYKPVLFPRDCCSFLAHSYQPASINSRGTKIRYKRRSSLDINKCYGLIANTVHYCILCPEELLWSYYKKNGQLLPRNQL